MSVPQFVFDHHCSEKDWIEKHDRYNRSTKANNALPFDLRNQIDFWKTNLNIRRALDEIEKEIEKIKKGEKITRSIVSWSSIAKRSKCARDTVKHDLRISWVKVKKEYFEEKITTLLKKPVKKERKEEDQLRLKLHKQRQETGLWFKKCEDLKREVEELKRIINNLEHSKSNLRSN